MCIRDRVHGGAFVAGTKDGIENYAVMLANEGYAVVGMDYQWAPEIQYPGQVRQVEECLVALESVKSTYHLDLNKIILIGDSAGAHIAAQAVLLATNPGYEQAIGVFSAITAEQLSGAVLYCCLLYTSTISIGGPNTECDPVGWSTSTFP